LTTDQVVEPHQQNRATATGQTNPTIAKLPPNYYSNNPCIRKSVV